MEEAIKLSKFLKRLMNFFHPFSHRFSDIERNKVSALENHSLLFSTMYWQTNLRWVKLGCTLLTTLLASPDGRRFLTSEDDLLKQLTRSFAQLDPVRLLIERPLSLTHNFAVLRRSRIRPHLLKEASFRNVNLWLS